MSVVDARIAALAGTDGAGAHRLRRLAESASPPAWLLLREHGLVDGRSITGMSLRVQYVHLTDILIGRILDGGFDTVLYLDKSARPVAWLVRALWPLLAPGFDDDGVCTGPTIPPAARLLNIDRMHWIDVIDPMLVGDRRYGDMDDDIIAGLRRALLVQPAHRERDGAALAAAPTFLTGRRVLVVDEVRVGGLTVSAALAILAAAFPDAEFDGWQWMQPTHVRGRDGNYRNNQIPVWYRHDTVLGRGIGDRDLDGPWPGWRAEAGRWFLSRPHARGVVDDDAVQLRREIEAVAAAVLRGDQVLVPAFERSDVAGRSRFFNGHDLVWLREWREEHQIVLHA